MWIIGCYSVRAWVRYCVRTWSIKFRLPFSEFNSSSLAFFQSVPASPARLAMAQRPARHPLIGIHLEFINCPTVDARERAQSDGVAIFYANASFDIGRCRTRPRHQGQISCLFALCTPESRVQQEAKRPLMPDFLIFFADS